MNLYQKIVEVRKIAGGFTKDSQSYGYKYVSGNQILSKIKEKMNDLNLLLIPSTKTGEHHTHEYKTKNGKDVIDFVVKGEMTYTWINGDSPEEREIISWSYYGQQDDISKAYGSALTFSERYFLLKCLGLPTDEDDPDGKDDSHDQQSTEPKKISSKQIGLLKAKVLELKKLTEAKETDIYLKLGVNDIQTLSSNQGSKAIDTVTKWVKQANEKQPVR